MSLANVSEDREPKYFATKKYKLWVREQISNRGWTYERFAKEVTRRGQEVSGQALHKLLGNEDEEPAGSNTALMPAINRALGLPVPSHFDPTTPLSRLHAALDSNWDRIPEETQRAWSLLIAGRDPAEK
jgi:hypothetical protein